MLKEIDSEYFERQYLNRRSCDPVTRAFNKLFCNSKQCQKNEGELEEELSGRIRIIMGNGNVCL